MELKRPSPAMVVRRDLGAELRRQRGFNSTNAGNELEGRSWKSLSFQRLSPVLSPGPGAGPITHHLDEAVPSLQQFSE